MRKLLKGLGAFGMGFANGLANMKPEERQAKINKIKGFFGWEKPAVKTEMSDWGKKQDDPYTDAWSGEPKPTDALAELPSVPDLDLPSASATPAEVETFPVDGSTAQGGSVEDFFNEAVTSGG